jgi:hypothetical protein
MKLSAPTVLLFLISLALTATGVIGQFQPSLLPTEVVANKFWFVLGGWGVLTVGVLFRGV